MVCPRCKATLESGAEFIAHLEAEHSFSDRAPSSDFQSQAGLGTVSGVSGEWGVWGVGCLGRGVSGAWDVWGVRFIVPISCLKVQNSQIILKFNFQKFNSGEFR